MTQTDVLSTDVLSPRTFCPHGRFVRRTYCPTDLLSPRTFCPHGRFVRRTFCPHGCFVRRTFCLYGRFVPTDVLSSRTFCPQTFCLRTFCLRTFCLGTRWALRFQTIIYEKAAEVPPPSSGLEAADIRKIFAELRICICGATFILKVADCLWKYRVADL
jgi:hypothetical protein